MIKTKFHSISKLLALTAIILSTFLLVGQEYETVIIGKQEWMKHNLNLDVLGSTCYEEDTLNCEAYGRLYAWAAAINVCPDGFRLPTDDDWLILTEALGGAENAAVALKTDGSSGFDAKLGGNFHPDVELYSFKNLRGYYWTASPQSISTAYIRIFETGKKNVKRDHIGKGFYFSVRCIKIQ
jgi:uncharacterized protein (TIGR02145 family)